jgi:hypothetical protein
VTVTRQLKATDFDVEAVLAGKPLTVEERAYLIESTPRFEEGMHLTSEGLSKLSDAELMREAYHVWADYASTQI